MKIIFGTIVCCLMLLGLAGCSSPQSSEPEYWGSFTDGPVISSDGLYRAEYAAIRQDGSDVSVILVNVYNNITSELLDSFYPARARDFWGICWEDGMHRIWIQSADIGTHCYELKNGNWLLNDSVDRPNSIVCKWD